MGALQTTSNRGSFHRSFYRGGSKTTSTDQNTWTYKGNNQSPPSRGFFRGGYRGNNFKGRGKGNIPRNSPSPNKQWLAHPSPDYTTPVGGRLQQFLPIWQSITSDKWVLGIIQHGYCLELTSNPPNIPLRSHKLSSEHIHLLKQEVQSFLLKGAIEPVPKQNQGSGVYSLYFLIPKKNSSLRPILDLRELNHYILSEHSHMVTHQQVLPLLQRAFTESRLCLL